MLPAVSSPHFGRLLWPFLLAGTSIVYWACGVNAYIPASPVNITGIGTNGSSASHLNLQWLGGGYQEDVSYQLVGAASSGVSKGALVHFSEEKLTNDTTTTPWIALVSCDTNATDGSQEDDIFTEARDRGAVAALLYSLYSERCQINPEYADPANFDQVMDIFATPSLSSSKFIEYQYSAINETKFGHFDPKLLNDSAAQINITIANGTISSKGFMFATLIAYNATDPTTSNDPSNGNTVSTAGGGGGNGGPNTSLAMIILYAITGCVSALFCVVIVSGAIRAIRHPERYGPRSGDANFGGPPGSGFGAAQSRARGLTRAILDTFPVVKFGRPDTTEPPLPKDLEGMPNNTGAASPGSVEMNVVNQNKGSAVTVVSREEGEQPRSRQIVGSEEVLRETVSGASGESSSSSPSSAIPRPRRPHIMIEGSTSTHSPSNERDIVPDAIGRETCPICIVDFEEGDDLRVLPCEGHHRFHQQCVDPWLLELSSSCPICRQDFHVLETMMNSDVGDQLEPPTPHGSARPLSTAGARFSRYIRMAKRRRGRSHEGSLGYDPTNPPMPVAPETNL